MPRVQVVDDELRICKFLQRALEAEGFDVDIAFGAHDALRQAGENDYALTILDLLMPGMDGYEVLRRIVEADRTRRILVLSAVGDVESRVRCLRMGAVDYLAKPFSIAELMERVKRRIEDQNRNPSARWLEVNGVRLDLHRRTLRAGGREGISIERVAIRPSTQGTLTS